MRKRIETAFSRLTARLPRHIHATSFRGFLLKVSWFIIAFALDKAFNWQLGLINAVSGSKEVRSLPLWRLQRQQANARLSMLFVPPCFSAIT
jgi:hypothetical protein